MTRSATHCEFSSASASLISPRIAWLSCWPTALPMLVNGATGQEKKNETQLVAIIAYNEHGAGNGVVVIVTGGWTEYTCPAV